MINYNNNQLFWKKILIFSYVSDPVIVYPASPFNLCIVSFSLTGLTQPYGVCISCSDRHKTPFHRRNAVVPIQHRRACEFSENEEKAKRYKTRRNRTSSSSFATQNRFKQWLRIAALLFLLPTNPPSLTMLHKRGRGETSFIVTPSFFVFSKLCVISFCLCAVSIRSWFCFVFIWFVELCLFVWRSLRF